MDLLLTSGGLTNEKLVTAFKDLVKKPLGEVSVAMIITATLGEVGDKRWFLNDLQNLYNTGVGQVDLVDLAGQEKTEWQPCLEKADVIWVEGGNTKRLMHYIVKSGLQQLLPDLLKARPYVGVSAGSMVMGECSPKDSEAVIYAEDVSTYALVQTYLQTVDAIIMPHFNSEYFNATAESMASIATKTKTPLYALDDDSALLVRDGSVQVVSDGRWKAYNV